MPSLIRGKRNYTPRNNKPVLAGAGQYPWDWILRVLDQVDRNIREDKQVLLSGGAFSCHGI